MGTRNVRRVVESYAARPNRPVVITPLDTTVQKAVNEMGPQINQKLDVVKLEPTCPGKTEAWVTNEDYLKGDPGKERVIHLCLKKIQDAFKKQQGEPYTMTDPKEQNEMKETIKEHLKMRTLPHELKHIEQEETHGGQFGPNPEMEAERAERPMKAAASRITMSYLKSAALMQLDDQGARDLTRRQRKRWRMR